jgi:hypothetical protein
LQISKKTIAPPKKTNEDGIGIAEKFADLKE